MATANTSVNSSDISFAESNDKQSQSRRTLSFATMEAFYQDAASWDEAKMQSLGKWTPAQNIEHVAILIEGSVHGFPGVKAPLLMKLAFTTLVKIAPGMIFNQSFKPGIKFPKGTVDFFTPGDVSYVDALQRLRRALDDAAKLKMTQASPLAGRLSHEQWSKLHCRHAEMHFSHIVPKEDAAG